MAVIGLEPVEESMRARLLSFGGAVPCFFFFNDPAPTDIYPLPLHAPLPIPCVVSHPEHATRRNRAGPVDSLPNCIGYVRMPLKTRRGSRRELPARRLLAVHAAGRERIGLVDRKSTRLNSSHLVISYAVFCLK